ncbi:MAG: HAD family hydrolase [Opitutales bacterium]
MVPALTLPPGDFAGYIFDCDGTLANSMPAHYRAWKQALEEADLPIPFTVSLFKTLGGMPPVETVQHFNRECRIALNPDEIVPRKESLLKVNMDAIQPVDAVVRFARKLKADGIPLSVASGSMRWAVEATLRIIGMEHFFPVVVTQDDVRRGKPDPETFLLAAERMKVDPRRCLVLEDAPFGFQAAEAAGMAWVDVNPVVPDQY